MKKNAPTHLYFKNSGTSFSRLMWFKANKENEMLLGFSGLEMKEPTLLFQFEDKEASKSDLSAIKFEYKNVKEVNKKFDHISCHVNGRFHIKLKNERDLYIHKMQRTQPLGEKTPRFLDFIIITDVRHKYKIIDDKPKLPNVLLPICNENEGIRIRGWFSGSKFDIESEIIEEFRRIITGKIDTLTNKDKIRIPAVKLEGRYLKGYLHFATVPFRKEIYNSRPSGTIMCFLFPIAEDKFIVKSLIFG